jgi:hypothetical protein
MQTYYLGAIGGTQRHKQRQQMLIGRIIQIGE